MNADSEQCCPRFNPEPWNEKTIVWQNKRFVQDRVRSIFHIPLNFGAVMTRNSRAISAAQAETETRIILSDENSLWGADVYIEANKDVPGVKMTSLSGTFLSKVYEGPYRNMAHWIKDMKSWVSRKGKNIHKLYFYYTTCPKCAKKYGKNYVSILAEVDTD